MRPSSLFIFLLAVMFSTNANSRELKILTNHVGYEATGPKHAVILGQPGDTISTCELIREGSDREVFSAAARNAGAVNKWRNWTFWSFNFDPVSTEGKYYLECSSNRGTIRSFPFAIQRDLLERNTLSDVIYYSECPSLR